MYFGGGRVVYRGRERSTTFDEEIDDVSCRLTADDSRSRKDRESLFIFESGH